VKVNPEVNVYEQKSKEIRVFRIFYGRKDKLNELNDIKLRINQAQN
jgi:hypothetical protein